MFPDADRSSDEFLDVFKWFIIVTVVISVLGIGAHFVLGYLLYRCLEKHGLPSININKTSAAPPVAAETEMYRMVPDSEIRDATVERFLGEIAGEKPIRFTPEQLSGFTNSFSARLGAGGFGAVYKGMLPNGLLVAVKVLLAGNDRKSEEEQFMAEVGTIGRTNHVNLVRLFGFCFDASVSMRALVYEYMDRGALADHLFNQTNTVDIRTRRAIAVGIARGLRYLHEECQHKIIHYDIKPSNILLDSNVTPKVADFGLAQLLARERTHVSAPGMRGTFGYAAPEVIQSDRVTEKCDVYSFGILLFEIVHGKRNLDNNAQESQRWFPQVAWTKYESGDHLAQVIDNHDSMDEQGKEAVERMCKVAFWCVQQQPTKRPPMGMVVKMLEGEIEIAPPANPFLHLMDSSAAAHPWMMSSASQGLGPQSQEVIIPLL